MVETLASVCAALLVSRIESQSLSFSTFAQEAKHLPAPADSSCMSKPKPAVRSSMKKLAARAMTPKMRESQSHHARQLLDAAQALKALLPKPAPSATPRLGRSANLPVAFLEQCAVFFDEQPQIATRLGINSDDIRTMIARTAALGPVVAEIKPMAGQLRTVLNQDRALVGAACLKAYDYAKSAARSLNDTALAEQASRMAQALNGRSKRAGAKPSTPIAKTSVTTTTTTTTTGSSGSPAR